MKNTEIYDSYSPYKKKLSGDYNIPYIFKILISIKTYEITTDEVRFVWMKRSDLQKAFPATNKFYQLNSDYHVYQWARDYGTYEEPEVFIENIMDWTKISASPEVRKEAEKIEIPKKKDNWLWSVVSWFLNLFK